MDIPPWAWVILAIAAYAIIGASLTQLVIWSAKKTRTPVPNDSILVFGFAWPFMLLLTAVFYIRSLMRNKEA